MAAGRPGSNGGPGGVKIAHVRERNAPAGTPFRLAAALDAGEDPRHWLDLEVARRRLVAVEPGRAHSSSLFRNSLTTLDDHLARGLRVAALGELLDAAGSGSIAADPADPDDDAVLAVADLLFGPPILRPPSFRDFYAFERHVATIWGRRGADVPEAWYRLPIFYFSNTSEIRGPGDEVWAPRGSAELDFELELGALVDTGARDLEPDTAEDVIGGYTIVNDWSARDLQRDETTIRLGPAKGKDFATSIGPWLVTPDELVSARGPGARMPDLGMTSSVHTADGREVPVSDGSAASAHFSFGDMVARASADVRLRPGDLIGSGTVGTGCLLEVRDETLGRYLEPGDEVIVRIERLGELRSPVVARPT
jgi:fumarylacetoacetate (FAA) hydrolase